MDAAHFLREFHDFLAPKLDTYEQALYLYVVRHSHLEGKDNVVVGFKSARKKLAFGIGKSGTPMSEGVCYKKIKNLQSKGCVSILDTVREGMKLRAFLPSEMPGLIQANDEPRPLPIDEMDFFDDETNRNAILRREKWHCFYCSRQLSQSPSNYVIEHVRSRPDGDNSYKNIVAACRQCNNKKDAMPAEDFLRLIYREGILTQDELRDVLQKLEELNKGNLKPKLE